MTAQRLVFFWENLGPQHHDRLAAVADALGSAADVSAVQFRHQSVVYDWREDPSPVPTRTLFRRGEEPRLLQRVAALWSAMRQGGRDTHYFLSHYEWPEVFAVASLLRLAGRRVTTMACTKFDDRPRSAFREAVKSLFLRPYQGAIASGLRSRDYMRFLGIPGGAIEVDYNTASVSRFRAMAAVEAAPLDHAGRDFVAITRLVPEKNLFVLLDAYAGYSRLVAHPRRLRICGNGPLEQALRQRCEALGIVDLVAFEGFIQTEEIAKVLANGLALLLPSTQEAFGNVVIEAQSLGVPTILSDVCGARDLLVRSGVNGFVVEPDNPRGMAFFMRLLHEDEALWLSMAGEAYASAERADASRFAAAVQARLRA
jgi:glycosyltransferase involved in cell wall biosynthesis